MALLPQLVNQMNIADECTTTLVCILRRGSNKRQFQGGSKTGHTVFGYLEN
jgi:hypothetical protein